MIFRSISNWVGAFFEYPVRWESAERSCEALLARLIVKSEKYSGFYQADWWPWCQSIHKAYDFFGCKVQTPWYSVSPGRYQFGINTSLIDYDDFQPPWISIFERSERSSSRVAGCSGLRRSRDTLEFFDIKSFRLHCMQERLYFHLVRSLKLFLLFSLFIHRVFSTLLSAITSLVE